ncbi:MAG: hypothetical protein Q9174_006334, partial [Haloplaca sp. 1 TL-2023]
MTLAEQEDADMQQAMQDSTSQLPQQQTGVVSLENPYFGPERPEHHDTQNWIMTTSKPTAKEIILNPEPQYRKREPNTPAFFRPSPAGHRIPALIKILHSIPAAREALLCRQSLEAEYSHQNEWWDGVSIESRKILHADSHEDPVSKDVVHECQRLQAFLDHTTRAYGSTEALSTLPELRNCWTDWIVKKFLDKWQKAVVAHATDSQLAHIFESTGVRIQGEDRSTEDTNMMDLQIDEERFESGQTLYDTIDSYLWPGGIGTEPGYEVFLEKVADVFVIRISRDESKTGSLDIKIPSVWYADRYRRSSQARIHDMLTAKAVIRKEMAELDQKTQRLSTFS